MSVRIARPYLQLSSRISRSISFTALAMGVTVSWSNERSVTLLALIPLTLRLVRFLPLVTQSGLRQLRE